MIRTHLSTLAWIALFVGSAFSPLFAQQPVGRTHPAARPLEQVATLAVAPLDRAAIAAEDATHDASGLPPRFAIPNPVQVTPATDGTWDVLDQTWSLWRLRIQAPGASHVNLGFTRYSMPSDAQLMIYSVDYAHVVRPFDASDNNAAHELWTPVVPGEEIVAELFVHTADIGNVDLVLGQVSSGYRFFGAGDTAGPQTDAAGSCNVDVACPQGNGWRNEIPAVAAYSTGGSVFCTGFMVNNTAQDRRNFFMTAYHCGIRSNNAGSMVVYWNYQNSTCGGNGGNFSEFTTGATFRAGWSTSDFTLVELNSAPNPAWGITYAGWDHSSADATSAVAIHHPSGDVKKISFEYQPTSTTSYLGTSVPGDGTHVRITDWDVGTTEPGSSGSPLFDQNHHVVGQLHGGYAACGNNLSDYYGRFSLSWTGGGSSSTRLSGWLDPLGTGASSLDTLGNSGFASATSFGQGCVDQHESFEQTFSAGTFDLAGNALFANGIVLTPTAMGYTVSAGTNAWFNPTSSDLALADDGVSSTLGLPFTFTHPGGSTSQIRMCSNGYVWLDGSSTVADYTPTVAELVGQAARLAPFWTDLNPTTGGSTHYDVSGGVAYLTWLGVPEYQSIGSNDVQCALFSNGTVEFRWRSAANTAHDAIVGYSPGNGASTPPDSDISASMPFVTGPDIAPLTLSAVNRPVLGTTQNMTVANIPAGSVAGSVFLGLTQYPQGIDLSVLGMPACRDYISLDSGSPFSASGSSQPFLLPIPSIPAFAGGHVFVQAITVSPGTNALGILTSNGVDLLLDQS